MPQPQPFFQEDYIVRGQVLTFLKDVVRLDMTKYIAKLVSSFPSPDGATDGMMNKYTLTSDGNKLDVICHLRSKLVFWCKVYPIVGSPIFAQPSVNTLDLANDILGRYELYSGVIHVQTMRSMLDNITELAPTVKAEGDVRLEVRIDGAMKDIQWMRAVNGITNNIDGIGLTFRNSDFQDFGDLWNRFPIGNTNVNVTVKKL